MLFAAALALPAAANAEVATQTIAGTRLDVTARGEVRRVPDVAVISAGVVTQARDARTALSDNAARMTRVLAALRKAGVAERDIATAQIALNAQYRYAENLPPAITGYQANSSVTVRFRDIARSGAILDALVAEGANQISGPSLTIDKPEAAQDEARLAAMMTARARAELYAKAAGLSVRRIVAISESGDEIVRPPVPYAMAMRADAAPKTEIVPGDQAVGVTLSVTFELN
ncbi:MAG: SIMPL domain-containing protein [Sphingomonadaceae bacterium]|nr:SIMPL domain-containing protein [Sphingomonadaceae bacterium]